MRFLLVCEINGSDPLFHHGPAPELSRKTGCSSSHTSCFRLLTAEATRLLLLTSNLIYKINCPLSLVVVCSPSPLGLRIPTADQRKGALFKESLWPVVFVCFTHDTCVPDQGCSALPSLSTISTVVRRRQERGFQPVMGDLVIRPWRLNSGSSPACTWFPRERCRASAIRRRSMSSTVFCQRPHGRAGSEDGLVRRGADGMGESLSSSG